MRRILVLGASSTIARSLCQELARKGDRLFLAGRDEDDLGRIAADLRVRFDSEVRLGRIDALDFDRHSQFVEMVVAEMGGLDGVVYAIGLIGDQPQDSLDPGVARRLVDVNFTSAVALLARAAAVLETQGSGFVLGLSSVAGDRGRQSNFVYGAAKAGLNVYLQGLRNRLDGKGVRVLTVKLGVVDTAMTYGLPALPLAAQPEPVARALAKIIDKPGGVYYVPFFWRYIMATIRVIPERLFKRMKI